MIPVAETNTERIVEKLGSLKHSDLRDNEFLLRSLKKEASKIQESDPHIGYALKGIISMFLFDISIHVNGLSCTCMP